MTKYPGVIRAINIDLPPFLQFHVLIKSGTNALTIIGLVESIRMNKDQALSIYVKENFNFLTSLELDRKGFKSNARQYFYTKHKNKFGIPKSGDICLSLVKYQIRNGVPASNILDQIDICPVFKDVSSQKLAELREHVRTNYESVLTNEEIERIRGTRAYEAIRELEGKKLKEEIEKSNQTLLETRAALEEDIKSKKQELSTIPSILDEVEIDEPEFDPQLEEVKSWWERFYLKDNPFPGNKDGLSKIDTSLFDQIVVKTKPYLSLLNQVGKNSLSLFDTAHMLVGDFGHGKTTFQDYLAYYLTNIDILPIRVTCLRSQPDCNGYLDSFILRLIKDLRSEADIPLQVMLPSDPDTVIELCQSICKTKKGIVVFLDDYHKHRDEFGAVYDFLGTLQILKNELTRSNSRVGFIVSAIPKWLNDLAEHSQMSGFFDSRPIMMPKPTPELITEVFNRRIAAYCYDTSPRQIQLGFVEQVFSRQKYQGNYRDYLNLIIEQLENNNMAIVNSPIEIADSELIEIENIYKKNSTIWSPLNKLLYGSKFRRFNAEQIAKCLELLVMIATQRRINEREPVFLENTFYFSRLKDVGLITKQKDQSSPNGFNWVISKALGDSSKEVHSRYGYNLSDYFLKLFSHKKNASEHASNDHQPSELSSFKKYLVDKKPLLPRSCLEAVDSALVLYDRFDVDPSDRIKRDQAIYDMRSAITFLGAATFEIDGHSVYFKKSGIVEISEQWRNHHYDDEVISDLFKKTNSYDLDPNAISYAVSNKVAKDAFSGLLDNLKETIEDITNSQTDTFRYKNLQSSLNPSDMRNFQDTKYALFSANKDQIFSHISKVTNHLELIFRSYLYASSILVFGEDKYFESVPGKDNKAYAYKNTSASSSSSLVANLYSGFTRSQFRQLFTQGSKLRSLTFGCLDLSWQSETWELFFQIFAQENINTSHQKVDSIQPQNRSRYITYCNLAVELIGAINRQSSQIFSKNIFIYRDDSPSDIESCLFRSGFAVKNEFADRIFIESQAEKLFSKDEDHEAHMVSSEAYQRVKSITLAKIQNEPYAQNLLDIDFISQHYGVKYCEYIFSLAYLQHIKKSICIRDWIGSRVRIVKL